MCVLRVSGRCMEVVWNVSRRCLKDFWRVSEGCLDVTCTLNYFLCLFLRRLGRLLLHQNDAVTGAVDLAET